MSNRLNDFINSSIKYIQSADAASALRYAPSSPMIFLYLDEHSLKFRDALCKKMDECWGHRAESFLHVLLRGGYMYLQDESGNWSIETDQYEITEKILDIEEAQFDSAGEVKVFFVLNTAGLPSVEQFVELYNTVNMFKEIEAVDFLNHFAIIEALAIRPSQMQLRRSIREFICTDEAQQMYNTVFLLSNQLPGGVLRGEHEARNYELLGSIVVICNNDDSEKTNRRNMIYNLAGNNIAITASSLKYQKPVRAITISSYITMLEMITRELFVANPMYRIPDLELREALQLKPSVGFEFIAKKLNSIFSDYLPKMDELKYLPNLNPETISIRPQSGKMLTKESVFAKLDSLTMGCWTPFYETNFHETVMRFVNDDFKTSIQQKIIQLLTSHFTYAQLAMLMESDAEAVIESGFPKAVSNKSIESYNDLYKYILSVIKEDLYNELRGMFFDIIKQVDRQAEEHSKMLDRLTVTLRNMSDDNRENADMNSISACYGNIVRSYVMKFEVKNKILNDFRQADANEESVLRQLESLYKNMVETCPEYKLPFEQELEKRITIGQTGVQSIIAESLSADDDLIISLKSNIKPNLIHGYYLARKEADYVRLVDSSENSIVDTNSASSAEHVRLYGCLREHLINE